MSDYLISLPPGYTIKAVLDSASNVQVWVITNGEVLARSIVGLECLQIVEWFPPDTPPVPPPPSVVLYECKIRSQAHAEHSVGDEQIIGLIIPHKSQEGFVGNDGNFPTNLYPHVARHDKRVIGYNKPLI